MDEVDRAIAQRHAQREERGPFEGGERLSAILIADGVMPAAAELDDGPRQLTALVSIDLAQHGQGVYDGVVAL